MNDYISLKQYFDEKIQALEKATLLAKESMEYRLNGMNEFRDALRDSSNNQVTKSEYDTWRNRVEEDIRSLRESRSLLEGKATQSSVNNLTIVSIVSLMISIISILLRILGL